MKIIPCAQPYARGTGFPGFRSVKRLRKRSKMGLPVRRPYVRDGRRAGQEKERRERRWGGEMRREEEGREVDGEGGGGEAGGEEGGEGGKAVGSIKLIEFITYCENVPPKEIFS